jgi:dTDP-4-amino-4,6-dideoxygalactose transaminase
LTSDQDPGHVYHLFPVRTSARDAFMAHLASQGIGSLIHYPIPIPRQHAFAAAPPSSCPVAERVCNEICSLPLHPHLSNDDADHVVAAAGAWRPSEARIAHG